jgi:hypothetical protein
MLPPPDGTVMLPLCEVESPEHDVQTYCLPDPAETGELHENE